MIDVSSGSRRIEKSYDSLGLEFMLYFVDYVIVLGELEVSGIALKRIVIKI